MQLSCSEASASPASTGGALDFESKRYVGQVKHVRRLSLTALEDLAREVERLGFQQRPLKLGVVIVKRRAGRGRRTPRLIVLTEAVWRTLARRMAICHLSGGNR